MTDRRTFLKAALGAGVLGLPAARAAAAYSETPAAAKPMKLLILGGTGFTGPFQVAYALARGHEVTVFNRGRTNPGVLPDTVEQLLGDRNGELDALMGREWDAVIDVPATLPRWVRASAQLLKDSVGHYTFVSSISVYADVSTPGTDETAPVHTLADPDTEDYQYYGGMKAASEAEARRAFPDRTLVIRPGLIVGPGDPTDRFTYWPVRIARGGEVLAPGTPQDPAQIIDARDLAEFIVRQVERRATGDFNATGPREPYAFGNLLGGIKDALGADARFTWADREFLARHEVAPWSHMPVWVPPVGEYGGFGRVSIAKALAAGLTFRPLADTARATLAWHRTRPEERQSALRAGITAEREGELLVAWHAQT